MNGIQTYFSLNYVLITLSGTFLWITIVSEFKTSDNYQSYSHEES